MEWQRLDRPTRVGCVATALAVILIIVPLFSVLSAVVALAASGVGWKRADDPSAQRRAARTCLIVSSALLVFLVVGSLIYAAGN